MLQQEQVNDVYISEIMQKFQTNGSNRKQGEYLLKEGILLRQQGGSDGSRTQLVVPVALRQMVLEELYDKSGHLGIHKTLVKATELLFGKNVNKMSEILSNNVSGVKQKLPWFQLSMLPLALLRAIIHLRSSRGTLWVHCQLQQVDASMSWW